MTTPIAECLECGGPPLPWLYGLAGRLEGEDRESMRTDAGALSRSLATAADLFDLPAVSTSFDTTLEVEAVGCGVAAGGGKPDVLEGRIASVEDAFDLDVTAVTDGGRVPTVLDATDRLVGTLRGSSVLGGLTGPRALAESLLGGNEPGVDADDDALCHEATLVAGDLDIELANAYLERGVDGIAVLEPDGVEDSDRYGDAVVPLSNVVDHYDATAVMIQRKVEADDVSLTGALGFDAITGRTDDPVACMDAAVEADIAVGLGVPSERFLDGSDAVVAFAADLPGDVLLSSEWEVPGATDVEAVHRLVGSR